VPIASSRCRLVPAAIMIANARTNRNSAVETFGCATIRPAAMPTTSIGRQICQSPRWLWKKAARYAITATFISSEGWKVTGPSGSQRRRVAGVGRDAGDQHHDQQRERDDVQRRGEAHDDARGHPGDDHGEREGGGEAQRLVEGLAGAAVGDPEHPEGAEQQLQRQEEGVHATPSSAATSAASAGDGRRNAAPRWA
jgi:hypothetical protein